MTQAQSTIVLARIVGPLLAVSGLALSARPGIMPRIIDAFATDPSEALLWGFVALLLGLTVLAFHQRWNGPVEIAITLLGWILILRGVILLLFPEEGIAVARTILESVPQAIVVIGAVVAAIGAWISFMGFRRQAPG
jgi:uncharacterized protein YjeT (DUF2065 family)